jgi:hypothetical protein
LFGMQWLHSLQTWTMAHSPGSSSSALCHRSEVLKFLTRSNYPTASKPHGKDQHPIHRRSGAAAYTFFKTPRKEIGKSFSKAGQSYTTSLKVEQVDIVQLVTQLLGTVASKGIEVYLSIDHVWHTGCAQADTHRWSRMTPTFTKTTGLYKSKIRQCKSCLWNGPM